MTVSWLTAMTTLLKGARRWLVKASSASMRTEFSDVVYEALTGERGAFLTRIAYIYVDFDLENPYHPHGCRL